MNIMYGEWNLIYYILLKQFLKLVLIFTILYTNV